jgi:putative transposase
MRYRRAQAKGGTFFFTVVTYHRRNILVDPDNIYLLKEAFRAVIDGHPFIIDAIVVLPDHLHCMWTLPDSDNEFPTRWRLIKSAFSRRCGSEHKGIP